MTLAYTIEKLLTQLATVERDEGARDRFGGEPEASQVVVAELRCRFWWWREGGSRSASKEYATPQRTINFTGGGVIVPLGSDIEDGDHITNIEDPNVSENDPARILVPGPFRVVAVETWEDHMEAALMRP